ncbi:MAG: hypothetical protein QM500_05620 [Methylococcales bacterium]
MNTKTDKSYQERLKKMKESVEKCKKDVLNGDFPSDVTVSGNPDLLNRNDSEIDKDSSKNNIDD